MIRARWLAAAAVVAGLGAGGCVNHTQNSLAFCSRTAGILNPSLDHTILTQDQAVYYDDTFEKNMRYSEDGSRQVRTTARNLADAYANVRKIAGDDSVAGWEVKQRYGELLQRRVQMREVCAAVERK